MAYRLCGLLMMCLWSPSFVHAQDGAAQDSAAQDSAAQDSAAQDSARVLFAEGVALADGGQWPPAVARFRAALAAYPSSVIEFNLGLALSRTGQLLEAIEVLERVAQREDVDPALRAEAAEAVARLQLQIAAVDVSYAGATEGLTLHVDGAPRPLADAGSCLSATTGRGES